MTIDIGTLIVSNSTPSGNVNSDANYDDWIWLNPSTGEIKKFNPSTGQYDISVPVASHEHATHGDINFTGKVSADGSEGLTGTKTIGGYTFSFKKGLLVGFSAP